jgi:hypothetical protein
MVAACVWDHAGGRGPLATFWSAVRQLDPAADDESGLAGVREGHLARLFSQAGLDRTSVTTLPAMFRHAAGEFDARVRVIGDGQWQAATPDGESTAPAGSTRWRTPTGPRA